MPGKLEGKVAVITGGTSGLGLATARAVRRRGEPTSSSRAGGQRELDRTVEKIGRNVTGVQGDISSLADLDRLYATVKDQKGRVDVLFANAGGGEFMPLGEITEAHYDKYFGINVKGTLFTVQKGLP